MKPLTTILLIIFFANAYAGEFPRKHSPKTPPLWDTLYYKNEVSLDVSLPLIFLFTGQPQDGSLALGYQRALTKHDYIRVSTRHDFEKSGETYNDLTDHHTLAPTYTLLPGSVITESTKDRHRYSPDIRFGYERRVGKRRIKGIFGMDILFGAEIETTTLQQRYFHPENIVDTAGNAQLLIAEFQPDHFPTTSKNINLKEGLAPFLGMFVHLSKHWSLRATMMYDIYWTQSISFRSESNELTRPQTGFNVGFMAPVADISVTCHF